MKKKLLSAWGFCAWLCLFATLACHLPTTEAIPTERSIPTGRAADTIAAPTVTILVTAEPHQADKYAMRFGVGGGLYADIDAGAASIYRATRELDQLGMVWLRHPGSGIAWYEVQPTRDTWDFRKLDAVVEDNDHPWLFPTYGMVGNVYPFGGFSEEHLRSLEGKEEVLAYVKAHGVDMSDPVQRADAEVYIKTLVERYRDRIRYWEIGGNEGIVDPQRFDIVANTYIWIKEAQPDALVVLTAVGGDDDSQFYTGLRALDALLERGLGDYFDIANFHYYGVIEGELEKRWEQRFDEYKAVLDKHGVRKPIWVTETSTSSYENSAVSGAGSEEIQARHVVQRLVVLAAKGAEKVFWYDFRQLAPDDKFYGCNLYDSVAGPKPAYFTFQLFVEKLGIYESVETLRADDVRLYRFALPNGEIVLVAWSGASQTLDLGPHVDGDKLLVTHIVEDDSTIPATEIVSASEVHLAPSPVFLEPIRE